MTHLSINRFAGVKRNSVQNQALLQYARSPFEVPPKPAEEAKVPLVETTEEGLTLKEQMLRDIEHLVVTGRQRELTAYFEGVDGKDIPINVGEWEIRVNVRRQDNIPVSRTVIAIPLTMRTRMTFERGCMAVLKEAGFSEQDAKLYYKAAWKKKYVWLDQVVSATAEMLAALNTTPVLDSYLSAPDPRALAHRMQLPKNPYRIAHTSFLVAVEMSRQVILARGNKTRPYTERINKSKPITSPVSKVH